MTLVAGGKADQNGRMAQTTGVRDLPEHNCWMLLRSAEVGRLALCTAEGPDVFPVNYVVDHGTIVFRTAEGSKLTTASTSDSVAFEVDGYDPQTNDAWSVVVKGRAEVVKRLHERIESLELPLFPWQASPKPFFVRIVPVGVTGRAFTVVERQVWVTPTGGARRSSPE